MRERRAVLRDPALLGFVAAMLGLTLWYGLQLGGRTLLIRCFWPLQVPFDVLIVVFCGAIRRSPGVPAPTRRFWSAGFLGGICFVVGDSWQALVAARREVIAQEPFEQAMVSVGVCLIVYAMLAHPVAHTGRGRLRLWLDLATTMAGLATFMWYFWLAGAVTSEPAGQLVSALVNAGLLMIALFGSIKLLLGGDAPFTVPAGLAGALAAALLGTYVSLPAADLDGRYLNLALLARLLPGILVALTPRLQIVTARYGEDPGAATRARESGRGRWLPYLVLAATQTLLIVVAESHRTVDRRLTGVLAGAAGVLALIVIRQLTVLADNAALLTRLDESLRELGRAQDRLWHDARHDGLTQLGNRTLLHERIQAGRERAAPGDRVALLLLDLDHFKHVNDGLGHHVGDALLVHIAAQLRAMVRPGDTVARLGGDEFVVLVPGATREEAEALALRLRTVIGQEVVLEGHRVVAGVSVGIAVGSLEEAEGLLREADAAMYLAKKAGREMVSEAG